MSTWRTARGDRSVRKDGGEGTAAYKQMMREVAERAYKGGEICWFHTYGLCKYQGAAFDWGPERGALSFTGHHIERVMDGGQVIPNSEKIVAAHRGCNSADGLRAQNARRAAKKKGEEYIADNEAIMEVLASGLTAHIPFNEPTSRNW